MNLNDERETKKSCQSKKCFEKIKIKKKLKRHDAFRKKIQIIFFF